MAFGNGGGGNFTGGKAEAYGGIGTAGSPIVFNNCVAATWNVVPNSTFGGAGGFADASGGTGQAGNLFRGWAAMRKPTAATGVSPPPSRRSEILSATSFSARGSAAYPTDLAATQKRPGVRAAPAVNSAAEAGRAAKRRRAGPVERALWPRRFSPHLPWRPVRLGAERGRSERPRPPRPARRERKSVGSSLFAATENRGQSKIVCSAGKTSTTLRG